MDNIVQINDISYEGSGVGKLDGQVVFVPKTLIGEKVEIEFVKTSKKYIVGNVKNILLESPLRIKPQCPYFDVCGGCDFQHTTYENEKKIKINVLQKEFSKIGYSGNFDFEECNKRFYYRNKIKFEVEDSKLGYYKNKTHDFFEVDVCPIASEKINNAIPKVLQFMQKNELKDLKNVYIREFENTLGICFLFDKNAKKCTKNVKNIENLKDFYIFFAYGEILESDKTQIFGLNLNGKLTDFDMRSFNQVNDFVAQKLYSFVEEYAKDKIVVNAYSGKGALTCRLAQIAKFVYGVEYQKSSHLEAEKLRKSNKKENIKNICGKVEDEINGILSQSSINLIILDPARAGCDAKVLDEIIKNEIEEIVYISCNFSTLVRDLKILLKKFTIKFVKIFDMFPLTSNMETVVVLKVK